VFGFPATNEVAPTPGHGYPERTESFNTFEQYVTTDVKELTSFVKTLLIEKPNRKDYVILEVNKQLEPTVEVTLS
jgi:hypothetical protein